MGKKKEKTADVGEEEVKQRRLEETTIDYFKRVDQVISENAFDDAEAKEVFVRNVFHQVQQEGTQLARHTLTSRVLEKLVPLFNAAQFDSLLEIYQSELVDLSCDRFASHVIETIVNNVNNHANCESSEEPAVVTTFCSLCKVLRSNCGTLIRDIYGHHVIGSCIQALSGIRVAEAVTQGRNFSNKKKKPATGKKERHEIDLSKVEVNKTHPSFTKQFKKLSKVIQEDDNFGELLCHRSASSLVQTLLLIEKHANAKRFTSLSHLVCARANILVTTDSAAADEEEEEEEIGHASLPAMVKDEVGSHMVETLIRTAEDDLFNLLVEKSFRRHLVSLALHRTGNYLVQTVVRALRNAEQAVPFCTKLLAYVEDILAAGHMGVIVALAETVARLHITEQQAAIVDAMRESLHIPKETSARRQFVRLLLCMMTHDAFHADENEENKAATETSAATPSPPLTNNDHALTTNSLNYHGVCLLRTFFTFDDARPIVNSFLSLTAEELATLSCYSTGSFCVENFFKSEAIDAKYKNKFVGIVRESLPRLATDKFGSRVLDAMFSSSSEGSKDLITNELRKCKERLEGDMYGRIMLFNCHVKQRPESEAARTDREDKKRKMFQEITNAKQKVNSKVDVDKAKPLDLPPPPKKKKMDRAERYRAELARLGISIPVGNSERADNTMVKVEEKMEDVETDDLATILEAIEATKQRT